MTHVLTLIADKAKAPLTAALVDHARTALEISGVEPGDPDWLAREEAVDIPFDGERALAAAAVGAAVGAAPVDIVTLALAGRRKRLLVADMDSTMIGQECIDELAAVGGVGDRVAAITAQAMRGETPFEPALRARVSLLAGLPVTAVDGVLSTRITHTPGGRTLVATMRANGGYTVLTSGGFTAFVVPIAAALGFDEHHASVLEQGRGRFTGRVAGPILGRQAKLRTLETVAAARHIPLAETLAVGDGANDIPLIRGAGLGVAFRAKPVVKAAAGAVIDHGDLTALLYLQGYRRDEFVE